MKTSFTLTQIAIVILFSLSTAQAKTILTNAALIWKPTTELTEIKRMDLSFLRGATIKIETLKDTRTTDPKKRIGENKEEPGELLPVETQADVAAFVTEHFAKVLKEIGAQVVEDKADITLSGELRDYFVTETNTYQGLIKMQLIVKKGGKVIWDHEISGKNSRFGRSYKYDNYMESLSDSLIDLVQRLLDNDEFKAAFQTKKGKN